MFKNNIRVQRTRRTICKTMLLGRSPYDNRPGIWKIKYAHYIAIGFQFSFRGPWHGEVLIGFRLIGIERNSGTRAYCTVLPVHVHAVVEHP